MCSASGAKQSGGSIMTSSSILLLLLFTKIIRIIYLLTMFNPQRKSKPSDIFMQEKAFQLHLDKVKSIRRSPSPNNNDVVLSEQLQQKYLKRLHKSKQEVKSRLSHDLHEQNQKLFRKLIETDRRLKQHSEVQTSQRHFNSYFSHKKEEQRIRGDNFGMIERMMNQSSMIPTLEEMKKEFKQSKRYSKMVRKLPAILRHEETAKQMLSPQKNKTSRYNSKGSLRSSATDRVSRFSQDRVVTQEIKHIQKKLVQKQ